MDDPDEKWTPKDIWTGVLFFSAGVLVIVFAILARRNGIPWWLYGEGWFVGPIFILIGGNGIYRALGSLGDRE